MKLYCFNEAGCVAFRQYIAELRTTIVGLTLSSILTSPKYVEETGTELPDTCPLFQTKYEMVLWLKKCFEVSGFHPDEKDVGLWTWLAGYMFESICPVVNETRRVLADPHYILDVLDYRRTYRHLVVAPWRVFIAAKGHCTLFLNEKPCIHGELMEQGMSRLYLMSIPSVTEAMERLYLDTQTNRAKRGIMSKHPKRGDFRNRFPRRIQQLMLTYDLMSMTADQLLNQLGPEFTPDPAQ